MDGMVGGRVVQATVGGDPAWSRAGGREHAGGYEEEERFGLHLCGPGDESFGRSVGMN